ncbi:MAG: hypothetical protein R3F30_10655 [Planctomycetota bacterium]
MSRRVRPRRHFDGRPAVVDGVTLEVAAGELHAVLGPAAPARPSLLRRPSGSVPAAAGSVLLGGDALAALPVAERARRAATLLQGLAPPPGSGSRPRAVDRHPHLGTASAASQGRTRRVAPALDLPRSASARSQTAPSDAQRR